MQCLRSRVGWASRVTQALQWTVGRAGRVVKLQLMARRVLARLTVLLGTSRSQELRRPVRRVRGID
jgi:hypothetical protein